MKDYLFENMHLILLAVDRALDHQAGMDYDTYTELKELQEELEKHVSKQETY